jgi:hypothetical protein
MIRFVAIVLFALLLQSSPLAGESGAPLRVRATLRNGSKLVGVVRNGALYERMKDGAFVRTVGPDVPGAGFRLWFVGEARGYLFLRHADVKKFEKIGVMTRAELHRLEQDLRKRADVIVIPPHRLHREEQAREIDRDVQAGEPARVHPETGGAEGEPAEPGEADRPGEAPETGEPSGEAPQDREPTLADLLIARFPPEEGWIPERRDEIERRKWVLGVFPSDEEKVFLENYPVWKQAYDAWLARIIERKAAEKAKRDAKEGRKGDKE